MATTCAVITGYHGYDVVAFRELFQSMPGVDAYVQHLDNFLSSPERNRSAYDCLLFYFMPRDLVAEGGASKGMEYLATELERHAAAGKGIVVLHHAILAYPDWKLWTEITGLTDRARFDYFDDQHVSYDLAEPDHSIVEGFGSWKMQDETYTLAEPDEDSIPIVTTRYRPSMHTIAWVRYFGESRVFCYESGHDAASWMNHNFRELLRRGILWTARELD